MANVDDLPCQHMRLSWLNFPHYLGIGQSYLPTKQYNSEFSFLLNADCRHTNSYHLCQHDECKLFYKSLISETKNG